MMSGVTAAIDTIDRPSLNVTEVGVWPAGRIAPTVVHCASATPPDKTKAPRMEKKTWRV